MCLCVLNHPAAGGPEAGFQFPASVGKSGMTVLFVSFGSHPLSRLSGEHLRVELLGHNPGMCLVSGNTAKWVINAPTSGV